ncbi:MAG: DUF3135 domain-containing protein [Pseudohongiella sp.]|nr:DUF3135 domain-containing protein [Pseudohongiella sp.]MDO9520010.1 DUF3135 domain-containing protein [Pseudohongiella sp.]MDP2127173.1 DUF3135 domain-containing protein [Pseudohongiella sp.]
MAELPDFDTLMKLHKEDPEALERLRQNLTSELMNKASDHTRRRLEGLQFRINMELRRASNPTARFLRLSDMMQESFHELNYCLNNPVDAVIARQNTQKADIVPLVRRTSGDTPSGRH